MILRDTLPQPHTLDRSIIVDQMNRKNHEFPLRLVSNLIISILFKRL